MSERLSSLLYDKKEGFLLQVWRCYSEQSSHYSPTFVHVSMVSVGTSSWWLYFPQGPEEMCLSLEHQNLSKTSEKMGYFDRVTVSLHIL